MLLGYMRVSQREGQGQVLDLQRDALIAAGVDEANLYYDFASGRKDQRPGLLALLKAARPMDTIVTYQLSRIGRSLVHLVNTVADLEKRGIALKILSGQGADMNLETPAGRLIFGIFATLSAWEAELTKERTLAGLAAARARGRKGGAPYKMTPAKLRLAMASMGKPETHVGDLCKELGITRTTLYRHCGPDGSLRPDGQKLLGQ